MRHIGFPPLFIGLCLAAIPAHAVPAIQSVAIFDDGRAHADFESKRDPGLINLAFPFCPTDRVPCDEGHLAWVQLRVSIDAYTARRGDPHDSINHILAVTRDDIKPLIDGLSNHFATKQVSSDVGRVSFVHGLIQAVNYEKDTETGWTDYPKFGIEFLVDEQGDCDDAAILTSLILDGLGYITYFVYWTGEPSAHLSTAIEPTKGDLQDFTLPAGSLWIEAPGLPHLLHVDGTGAPGGCGKAWISCGGLGFNEWKQHGLQIRTVVRTDDPGLESRLPLSAWSNGGLERPDRKLVDRRRSSGEEIRDEIFDVVERSARLSRRLEELGVKRNRAGAYLLRRRYPIKPIVYFTFLVICTSFLAGFGIWAWNRRRERIERSVAVRVRREAEKFLS